MLQKRWTRLLPRNRSSQVGTLLLFVVLLELLFRRVGPTVHYYVFPDAQPTLLKQYNRPLIYNATAPSVNLVLATVSSDNTNWASNLQISNLQVIRYVNDDSSAKYHPPTPKGREALMYFTYLHDFYNDLPDVSIFVHGEELQWHVEGTLLRNTSFALSRLDLVKVIEHEYFNLRVTWRAACPWWINTTKTFDDWEKQEEPYMRDAWSANFGEDDMVPETLGGPCCSQFAVSRSAVHSRPKDQYKRSMDWLIETEWSDYIAGRVWEHMWPKLFKNEASDCGHEERRSLCEMYGLCWMSDKALEAYKELWEDVERLKERMSFFRAVWKPGQARAARKHMGNLVDEIERQLGEAIERGRDAEVKARVLDGS